LWFWTWGVSRGLWDLREFFVMQCDAIQSGSCEGEKKKRKKRIRR
jgi:hypothetical protein